ncbi:MAG: GTP-binding protein [Pseudomonadota bacterium]
MDTADPRIPVTLLTGFLGAGKTTLLNHLIRDPDAGRIAVVMNEFGDVGLDHDLIEEATEETILLDSGCLCCSIRGDLATTLAALMERRKQGDLAFDRVVIETTGIADPGPVLHTLVMSDLIAPDYRMDGVVTLADAASGPATLDRQFEAVHQIAVADVVVLTKTDLVPQAELQAFEARVGGINGTAPRIRADHGRVPLGTLFGLSAMRDGISQDDLEKWMGDKMVGQTHAHHHEDHHSDHAGHHHDDHAQCGHAHHDHDHHHHDARIVSASITLDRPIPASVFDFWLDMLMALKGPDLLRMKGIVHVEGMDWPFVFHGVQHIFDQPVPLKSWTGGDTTSRIVVIARDMTKDELEGGLNILRMQPKEVEPATDNLMVETLEMPF